MGSFEVSMEMRSSALLESPCGYLLQELELIWDEIGHDQLEREKSLLEIEQECLDVYRRKVDKANMARAKLHQSLADSEAEFTHLLLSLGERSFQCRPERMTGSLKEQLDFITPALVEMQLRKEERVNQFRAVQMQIRKINAEIEGCSELETLPMDFPVDESDLSLKKLEEYRVELQRLHREKSDRLLKVEEYTKSVRNLAITMGMDALEIITSVHPSLDDSCGRNLKNISDAILDGLNSTVESLKEEKQKRLDKLHKLGKSLKNLWNLMDASFEDRFAFSHICDLTSFSTADVSKPGSLALDIIHQAESEVERLDQLKASKMKELFIKKQLELKEIYKRTHMEMPSQSEINNLMSLINSGEVDHADLLASMDEQISKAEEEACSRTEIMDKVEKWIISSDEERWLEEYSRDENRYSVSRGAHKNLKRAERARITVSKIPSLVDLIISKTKSWEVERKKVFMYDEVPLLTMLEEYNSSRQEKEQEKQRRRENKKVQVQVVQQENLFQSRPSTSSRRISNRSLNESCISSAPSSKRHSMGIHQAGSNSMCSPSHSMSFSKDGQKAHGTKTPRVSTLSRRDDTVSQVSNVSSPLFP